MSVDHEAIFRAAGIQSLRSGASPLDVLQKILGYGLLRDRVFTRLVEKYAAEVLSESFHQIELERLRVYSGAETAKPKFLVQWFCISPDQNMSDPSPQIIAKAFLEGSQTADETRTWQPRTLEEARLIKFRGEAVPGDILFLYHTYIGGSDPLAAADAMQNERNRAIDAQKEHDQKAEAIAAALYR